MKQLFIIAAMMLTGCQLSTQPPSKVALLHIQASIAWDSPYDDLNVLDEDQDSIIRTYYSDTVDAVELDLGTTVVLHWYNNGKACCMRTMEYTVTGDTVIVFNNGIK